MARPMGRSPEGPEDESNESDVARRRKPRTKVVETAHDRTELTNRDPSRWYQFVDPTSRDYGLKFYKGLGYRVEVHTKNGVRLKHGGDAEESELGQPIELIGQVLVSIESGKKKEQDLEGVYGGLGLNYYRTVDRSILKKNSVPFESDARSEYATLENETKARETIHLS